MLSFEAVHVYYGKRAILQGIDFSLVPHTITVLLGKNGSGKSTLLSCLNSTVRYTGSIFYQGQDLALLPLRERAKQIAILPQTLPCVGLTVNELVQMGRNPYLDLGKRLSPQDHEQVEAAIHAVGLTGLRHQPLPLLSGGERQKAYLAMVLAQNTRLIVLDEPTTHLDLASASEFLQLLKTLKSQHKKTILLVMHDLTKAIEIADQLLILDQGRLAFHGSRQQAIVDGRIEAIFGVKRSTYTKDGIPMVMYYR